MTDDADEWDLVAQEFPGWSGILYAFRDFLEMEFPEIHVGQVKEKFGGLRIYLDDCSDDMWQYVKAAEFMSAITCQECAKPGRRRADGWIRTLCDDCRNDRPRREVEL